MSAAILRLPVCFYRARWTDTFVLEYLSEGVRDICGYTPEALVSGQVPVLGLLHADDRSRVAAAIRWGIAHDEPFDCRVQVRGADGVNRWLRVRGVGVKRPADAAVVIEGFVVDATALKRAEDERNTMKLESLGLLARGIAHDFNNLLQGIRGNAELLRMVLPGDSAGRKYVDTIELTAQRAVELTQLLHAYGGQGSLRTAPVNVSALVADMLAMLEPTLRAGVRFEHHFGADLPVVPGDATQIRQVLLNLATNASQALNAEGGVVRFETHRVLISGNDESEGMIPVRPPAGEYVALTVIDDGAGMERSTLARIFDPFFSTRPHGKGLGLMTVLAIVRAHRGAVRVTSEVGKGTTFQVLFPCVRAASGTYRMIG